jgi:hypothetical protein
MAGLPKLVNRMNVVLPPRALLSFLKSLPLFAIRLLGLLFCLIGVLKLHTLIFPDTALKEYLALPNPLFIIPNKYLLLVAALVEIIVGFVTFRCLLTPKRIALLILWFSLAALAYKVSLALVHYEGPCGCLLGIHKLIPVSMKMQKWFTDILLLFSILVSILVIIECRLQTKLNNRPLAPGVYTRAPQQG